MADIYQQNCSEMNYNHQQNWKFSNRLFGQFYLKPWYVNKNHNISYHNVAIKNGGLSKWIVSSWFVVVGKAPFLLARQILNHSIFMIWLQFVIYKHSSILNFVAELIHQNLYWFWYFEVSLECYSILAFLNYCGIITPLQETDWKAMNNF